MKRSIALLLLLLSLVLSTLGCGPGGDMLYLRNKGADMPVWIRGRADSDAVILVVHGGPGGTSFVMPNASAFASLEARYGVAYWEQRSSGSAQGDAPSDTLTVAQFREDLGLVVDLVRSQRPGARLYLMGYSWGGLLTALYLSDPAARAKVAGWIDYSGSHDVPLTVRLSREWILQRARSFVAAGTDAPYWSEALDWYASHPALDAEQYLTHAGYLGRAGGGSYTGRSAASFGVIFDSPFAAFASSVNGARTVTPMLAQILPMDATPLLGGVTLPALVIAGREDGQVPAGVAEEAFAALGTPADRKELVLVDRAAHALHMDAPEAFAAAVTRFVDRSR